MAKALNYYTYEDIINEDDDSVERKPVVRCMHCLDTIVSVGGKINSSYGEKRVFAYNGHNKMPTYIQAIVCHECKNKELDIANIINQIRERAEISMMEKDKTDTEIADKMKRFYNLTQVKDNSLLKKCEKFINKQTKNSSRAR